MDRFSNLPDDVICHIISFLSAKEATCLKFVSKNFRNLVTIKPNVVFDLWETFKNFADGLLAETTSYRIRRFSLKLGSMDFAQYKLLNDCLCNVLKRGVLDLELDINVKEDYILPFEVFTCKTVIKLKLGCGFVIDILPKNALLPALKTLILDLVRFDSSDGCAFTRLLSASPVLEELVINRLNWEHWKGSRFVSSPTLKRVTIRRKEWEPEAWTEFESVSFDTPSLTYFEYKDVIPYGYPIVNLNSIVEARLTLPREVEYDWVNRSADPSNLIKGLKNVEILSIKVLHTMQLVFFNFREAIPVFENLFHLSVDSEPEFCWDPLQILLKKSPNLKTLTIEGTLHYNLYSKLDLEAVCTCLLGYSFLLSCPIKVLKITKFVGDIGEIVQVKHVLGKLPCLELLEVDVQARRDDKKQQIMADLLMLPRASSKCKVLVKFS
ncbi:F-box domain [Arabidopsis suecica]|uniref:F-box domain n=1 Tax=Arabidopsis suecica TaxID=45249 RepID=A0A8T1ZBJ5_ARASU|nr:F-box domain [Arabidopsis suecica]